MQNKQTKKPHKYYIVPTLFYNNNIRNQEVESGKTQKFVRTSSNTTE